MNIPYEHLAQLIDKQSFSHIGSVDAHGFPNIKAMLPPRKREGLQEFWFTTNTSSMRVEQYRQHPEACVYFSDPTAFEGVMLKGRMEVLTDSANKEMIWRPGDELYYPLGVTDPDYCVLHFTAIQGRLYSHFHSENFDIR